MRAPAALVLPARGVESCLRAGAVVDVGPVVEVMRLRVKGAVSARGQPKQMCQPPIHECKCVAAAGRAVPASRLSLMQAQHHTKFDAPKEACLACWQHQFVVSGAGGASAAGGGKRPPTHTTPAADTVEPQEAKQPCPEQSERTATRRRGREIHGGGGRVPSSLSLANWETARDAWNLRAPGEDSAQPPTAGGKLRGVRRVWTKSPLICRIPRQTSAQIRRSIEAPHGAARALGCGMEGW